MCDANASVTISSSVHRLGRQVIINYDDVLLYFSTLTTPSLRLGGSWLAGRMNGGDHEHDDFDSFLLTANAHIQ